MYVCDSSITSGIVGEFAERLSDSADTRWRVSWLPGQVFTREQAMAAIELVELLYDPARANDTELQASVAAAATTLGIRPIDAAATLSQRHPNR
ncbi:hypothetical protein [Nocardia sp. NPDC005978]|uniref:hypothetical protein n=1 Tax=unclassified Nocardia TaxID=2637762 RepID=UPI0033AC9ACE